MDALTLLKADHKAVATLFARYEQLGDRALKAKAAVLADQESRVLEALEEHHIVKWTLDELDGMKQLFRGPDTPPLNALVTSVAGSLDSARDIGEAAVRKLRAAVSTR